MIIRKLYRFEGAHIVRNCTSRHCRENIHGHSYTAEVFITSDRLDQGCMILDFGRLAPVKRFIQSFDHAYYLWLQEEQELKDCIYRYNNRVVELPVSPSAEGLALLFFYTIDKILQHLSPVNGEGHIQLSSVRIHETATGYAEAFREDLQWVTFNLSQVHFSTGIQEEWEGKEWWNTLQLM